MAVLARSWVTLLALLSLRNTCYGSRDLLTFRSTDQGPTPRILETIGQLDHPHRRHYGELVPLGTGLASAFPGLHLRSSHPGPVPLIRRSRCPSGPRWEWDLR